MKTILLTADFLFHSFERINSTLWEHDLFLPIIKNVVLNANCITIPTTNDGEKFSREYFFSLGGINNPRYYYQQYDISKFNSAQIEYLKKFFNEDTVIIGFELYEKLSKFLESFGCQIIDFAFHPFKLFDDLTFGIATTNQDIYSQLLKYQIPQDKFYFYANYWKTYMKYNKLIQDKDLEDNSALFIGQTLLDKSVEKNGIFLNVTHYEEKLKELSKKYSKIYYLPHPFLGMKRRTIYNWIKKRPYIQILDNCSTYGLLASDKISKVVGISTSVIYEANYFNKNTEYWYKPLFNVDTKFEEYSYVSILDDYFSPKFWAEILAPVCDVNNDVDNVNYFKGSHNKIRNIQNLYWGYAQLDPIQRIPNFKRGFSNICKKIVSRFW